MPSEFDLIRRYFQRPPLRSDVVLGSGDDAALLQPPAGMLLAATTDTLVSGRHFHEHWPAADIGWRALAVNLSDLAAMGAQPAWFTCALTIPEADENWLAGFASGLFDFAAQHRVDLVGGNLSRGPLSVTIQALGFVKPGQALRRDGAKAGDLVCVTGTLGDAALALKLEGGSEDTRPPPLIPPHKGEGNAFGPPPLVGGGEGEGSGAPKDTKYLLRRLRRPTPRIAAGLALAGVAHAAIDISDGLAADLRHILEASGVGAEISSAKLPASPAFSHLAPPASRLALQLAGDDYELCVCLPRDKLDAAKAGLDCELTVIGEITSQPGLRDLSGASLTAGYDHFEKE